MATRLKSFQGLLTEQFNQASNAIHIHFEKQNFKYRLNENPFFDVENPDALQKAAASLTGRAILNGSILLCKCVIAVSCRC